MRGAQCGVVTLYVKHLSSTDRTTHADDGALGNAKGSGETRSHSFGRRTIDGPFSNSHNEFSVVGATHARTLRPGVDVHG